MVGKLKDTIIYDYGMSVTDKISKLSKNGCDDALLDYIRENYDEIVCELNGGEYVIMVVGWRSCLTQCRTVTEVKHGRARSGVGWVTAQVIDQ